MRIARRRTEVEIPTASMADVAFLLIVFFLVAAFYSVSHGIVFTLPRHDEKAVSVEAEAAILVEVEADGSILLDGAPAPLGELSRRLRGRAGFRTEPVILRTDGDASYGDMARVLDVLERAGVRNVVVPTSAQLAAYGLGGGR